MRVWWCEEHRTDSVVSSTDAEGKWMGIVPEFCWYWQYLRGPKNEKPCRFVEMILTKSRSGWGAGMRQGDNELTYAELTYAEFRTAWDALTETQQQWVKDKARWEHMTRWAVMNQWDVPNV